MSFHEGVLAALSTRGTRKVSMYAIALASLGVLMVSTPDVALSQGAPSGAAPKTLVVVGAHADDEGPVAPILARYAREGVQVYLIIASDGVAGCWPAGQHPAPRRHRAGRRTRPPARRGGALRHASARHPAADSAWLPRRQTGRLRRRPRAHLPRDAAHRRGTRAPSSRCGGHLGTGWRHGPP